MYIYLYTLNTPLPPARRDRGSSFNGINLLPDISSIIVGDEQKTNDKKKNEKKTGHTRVYCHIHSRRWIRERRAAEPTTGRVIYCGPPSGFMTLPYARVSVTKAHMAKLCTSAQEPFHSVLYDRAVSAQSPPPANPPPTVYHPFIQEQQRKETIDHESTGIRVYRNQDD